MSLPSFRALRDAKNRSWRRGDWDVAESFAIQLAARLFVDGKHDERMSELQWLSRYSRSAGWSVVCAAAAADGGNPGRARQLARKALKGDRAQLTLHDAQRLVFLADRGAEPPRLLVNAEEISDLPGDARRAEDLLLYGEAFEILGLRTDAFVGFFASATVAEREENWPLARRALECGAALRPDPVMWARLANCYRKLRRPTRAREAAKKARAGARRNGGAAALRRIETIIEGTPFNIALQVAAEAYLAEPRKAE